MAPTVAPPLSPKKNKIKQYSLIASIYVSQYQAGTAISTNVFGPYDTLEECRDAGEEARMEFVGGNGNFYYTCVPSYRKPY